MTLTHEDVDALGRRIVERLLAIAKDVEDTYAKAEGRQVEVAKALANADYGGVDHLVLSIPTPYVGAKGRVAFPVGHADIVPGWFLYMREAAAAIEVVDGVAK